MARKSVTKKTTAKATKKLVAAKASAKSEELIQTTTKVLGRIPTELRLRMKNVTASLDQHRATMANLAFQHTDLRMKMSELEAAEAQELRVTLELNAELGVCRKEIEKQVTLEAGTGYRVDLDTGDIVTN